MSPHEADDHETTRPLSESLADPTGRVCAGEEPLLLLIYHEDGVIRVHLNPDKSLVLGRALPAQVQVRDPSVSREHARFTLSRGALTIEDLGSTNGTWVGGARVKSGEARPGDRVLLGSVVVWILSLVPNEGALPSLTTQERFHAVLEEEVARARHFQRSLALLMARAVCGDGKDAPLGRSAQRILALLRRVDQAAIFCADTVGVLLVESGADAARGLARNLTASGADGAPTLLVGIAMFPDAAATPDKLIEACWRAVRQATPQHPAQLARSCALIWSGVPAPAAAGDLLVVSSPAMHRVFNQVAKLARSPIQVLLRGETGTGKEVVAQAIHAQGPRCGQPMVCVNCGAIPQQLVESTLFGHERGSFTGATQQQKGVFEGADKGTVFLDEIGELPAPAQAALLRVLETRRVTRVGSTREIELDVRVIAATHRDLEAMSDAGAFRLDLVYRLNAFTLVIPPLRERQEEIEPLIVSFLHQANKVHGRTVRGIEPGALALLRRYSWPGNVRELRNAIEQAVVFSEGEWIGEWELPERIRSARPADARPGVKSVCAGGGPSTAPRPQGEHEPALAAPEGADCYKARLQRYESELIVTALREAGWNQTEAARGLGMPLRTLVHKLKSLGISKG